MTGRIRNVVAVGVAGWLLGAMLPARASVDTPDPTSGLYDWFQLVAYRPIAGGSAPTATPAPGLSDGVNFGEIVTWLDGRECSPWDAEAVNTLPDSLAGSLDDPNLADLRLSPAGEAGMLEDHRRNQAVVIGCDRGPFAELVVVDDRVLYTRAPGSDLYAVLERPLPRDQVEDLQRRLAAAGFDPGPVDGVLGGQTRAAVAAYAAERGAGNGGETGVVTENLVESIAFSAAD